MVHLRQRGKWLGHKFVGLVVDGFYHIFELFGGWVVKTVER